MAVRPEDRLRPAARHESDSLFLGLAHFVRMGGHLRAGLQADELDVAGAEPQRGAGSVEERVVVAPGLQELLCALGQRLPRLGAGVAQDGPGHVDGHVATAYDHDPLPERHAIAEVRVQQEVDAVDDAVELPARNVQLASPGGPEGEAADRHRHLHAVDEREALTGRPSRLAGIADKITGRKH